MYMHTKIIYNLEAKQITDKKYEFCFIDREKARRIKIINWINCYIKQGQTVHRSKVNYK